MHATHATMQHEYVKANIGVNGISYPNIPSRKWWILCIVRIDLCSVVANVFSIRSPGLRSPAPLSSSHQLPWLSRTWQVSSLIDGLTTLRRHVLLVNIRLGLVTATPFERSKSWNFLLFFFSVSMIIEIHWSLLNQPTFSSYLSPIILIPNYNSFFRTQSTDIFPLPDFTNNTNAGQHT